ncbi:hypothetical protein F4861DRAFT_30128 [Xylaria intraflava]|nr:hypothetical protein F4861DRAFT_30128 [Xylaria intraflava]
MTRERKKAPASAHGVTAATRRAKMERALQFNDSVWRNLNPLKAPPKVKHKSYFEAVENADKKKKKLEFEVTTNPEPPPGFEFIPTGHPELSQECKEQSRDSDAMFFIVSISKDVLKLDHHMNRLGYHFRSLIVEAAREALKRRGCYDEAAYVHEPGRPEPIPSSQREIDQEADAVLRDLFPRIPNTDRQEIINHAFKKDGTFNGEFKVGMAKELTLARRVQLAALAHIRHTHTRYDELLKESKWANARKAVEKPCLDIIVKWRGDEETGRDQLDEILREVIEISDTEDESDDEINSTDNVRTPVQTGHAAASIPNGPVLRPSYANQQFGMDSRMSSPVLADPHAPPSAQRGSTRAERRTARKTQQRFKRYAAAAEALANASNQDGRPESHSTSGLVAAPTEVVRAHPVNSYHTIPSAVTHEVYRRAIHGHTEIQKLPLPHSSGVIEDRMTSASDARIHGGTEQFIRIPDAQRPKVGPYSAKYGQPSPLPPLSPARQDLQDMVLPSIEPRSPDGPRVLHDVSQRVYREPQESTEVPRVISRTIFEPVAPGPCTRSPGSLVNGNELAAKRRRVTTYFHEDFQRPSNTSYVRAAPQGQDDGLRHPQLQYIADRRPLMSRGPDHVVYQDVSWPPSGQEVRVIRPEDRPDGPVYQSSLRAATRPEFTVDAPVRPRGNQILVNENGYEPRRVVEMRRSPVREIYRTTSPRGVVVQGLHGQEDPRVRDPQAVIYIDESAGHLRGEPSNRHRAIFHHQPGPPAHREVPRHLSPNISRQAPAVERSTWYSVPYDKEIVRASELEQAPLIQHGTTRYNGTQAPLPEAPRLERFPESQQHNYRSHPYAGAVQHAAPQGLGNNVIYRSTRPDVTTLSNSRYERGPQQPFPVFPAPSSYAEIRGPPMHQRLRNDHDIIYVG